MNLHRVGRIALGMMLVTTLSACGGGGGLFGNRDRDAQADGPRQPAEPVAVTREQRQEAGRQTIWSVFTNSADPNTTVEVNRYLWQASLEVLNFLPVESVDPFTGVIVTGFGRPPGGGQAYRATIYVQDPALDARSLKIALQGQGGRAVAPETVRAVEDAILTRARQIRVRDGNL